MSGQTVTIKTNRKMSNKVKSVKFNWHQSGSSIDRDGAGENWERAEVGKNGVISIEENEPRNGNQVWNYVLVGENGVVVRIFNPNFVEYFN